MTRDVQGQTGETKVPGWCALCRSRCGCFSIVKEGRLVRIEADPSHPTGRALCAKGQAAPEQVYSDDRLLHPMKRTRPKDDIDPGWVRISWDEALDEVARELLRVREQYGNAAILDASRSGNLSMLHSRSGAKRFLNMFGGCTDLWSSMSCEAEIFAVRHTFGPKIPYKAAGREPTDYVNSKLILMWGWSPADGTFGTGTPQFLKHAKEHGVRIVCVDARRTRSSKQLADEHIFIKPSTDAAMLIAMTYVIVGEGLHDQAYCDAYVQGFDEATLPDAAPAGSSYRAYLMGESDGVPKTPEWAAERCGVPAETIRRLALDFGSTKPAALHCLP